MLSLICAWINRWVNNRETGDLRRHRAHYDAIVIVSVEATYILGSYLNGIGVIVQWNIHDEYRAIDHLNPKNTTIQYNENKRDKSDMHT